jgi:hypothetical protein
MQVQLKKVLFFPQNKTHIDNMLPVAKQLVGRGYDIFFLDASLVYNQYIYEKDFKFNKIELSLRLEKTFAFLSFLEKIQFIKRYKIELLDYNFEAFDSFIYGNDGALQRVLIDKYKSKKHFLILDGIISDYSFSFIDIIRYSNNKFFDIKDSIRRRFKKILNMVFAYLPYNYYLPSDVGCSNLTKVFVISDYVSRHVRSQILRDTQVIVSGMPRYKFLKDCNSSIAGEKLKILYITQGYAWHNEYENDRLQHETIKKLIANFEANKLDLKYQLTVRVHPRDEVGRYDYISRKTWVTLEDKSTNIYTSINNNNIVLGVNSTVLLEAMSIGKKVIFLFFNNQFWRFKRSFINHNIFDKAFSFEQFMCQISNMNIDSANSDRFEYFFHPNAKKSIDIIVNEITKTD